MICMATRSFDLQGCIAAALWILAVLPTSGQASTQIIDRAIKECWDHPPADRAETERRELARSIVAVLSDDQLLESTIEWAYEQDGNPYVGSRALLLLQDVGRPAESRVLRNQMADVLDAQKAYKLISISRLFRDESFVAEMAHLLQNTGDAFTHIQERPPERICDVAYRSIVASLAKAKADFHAARVSREGEISHEDRASLRSWLAENWPGCQTLGATKEQRTRSAGTSASLADRIPADAAEKSGGCKSAFQTHRVDLRWVVSAAFLVIFGIIYLFLKRIEKSKNSRN